VKRRTKEEGTKEEDSGEGKREEKNMRTRDEDKRGGLCLPP
jgi:hypothetical protein